MSQFNQQFIILIINRYGLELEDDLIDSVVATWIGQYDRTWIVKAIVESLHRGRYKIKSVDSILSGWQRTGKLSYNFPPEFEREILQDLPTISNLAETQAPSILSQPEYLDSAIQFPSLSSTQLNPEESAPFPHHDRCRSRQADRTMPILQSPQVDFGTALPQAELGQSFVYSPPVVGFHGEDNVKPNHNTPHPQFQLFNTLRAIVTPNNVQENELDDLQLASRQSCY